MPDELDDVLRWVNSVREKHGDPLLAELPKGVPQNGDCCVIASALSSNRSWCCAGHTFAEFAMHASIDFPDHVIEFIQAFDKGVYPHLLLDGPVAA